MKWGRKNRAFQFSDVFFPISWILRLKQEKQSRLKTNSGTEDLREVHHGSADHLRVDASYVPRRRSTGDDDARRKLAFGRERQDISRSARHLSLGELELRPISVYPSLDLDSPPKPMKRAEVRARGQRMKPKVKVRSPRAGQKMGEEWKREKRKCESFAMVKISSDPQKDFRESMMEMVLEKRMRRPEELERLLACYICLNADEHHDIIFKAFRQVWFDLPRSWLGCGECRCCHGLL